MQQPDTETHTNTDEMITEPKWNSHRSLYFSSMNTSTKFYTSHIGLCLGVWMCKHTIKPCLHITKFSFYLKISARYSVHNGWQTHSARHHWHNNGPIFLSKNKIKGRISLCVNASWMVCVFYPTVDEFVNHGYLLPLKTRLKYHVIKLKTRKNKLFF